MVEQQNELLFDDSITSRLMQLFSMLSMIGCFAIVMMYSCYPKIRLFRHLELVFYVALVDFFSSSGTVLGYLENGTVGCWYQGIASNYGFVSSSMWTTVISYQLYSIVGGGIRIDDSLMFKIHLVCWGVPLLFTVLPLSTNTYGNADGGVGWCFIGNRPSSPKWGVIFWEVTSFFAWLWLCIAAMFYFYVWIIFRIYKMKLGPVQNATAKNLLRFTVYPAMFVTCWLVNTIENWKDNKDKHPVATALPTLQGFFNCVAFILTNKKVRTELYRSLCGSHDANNGLQEQLLEQDASQCNPDSDNENYDYTSVSGSASASASKGSRSRGTRGSVGSSVAMSSASALVATDVMDSDSIVSLDFSLDLSVPST